ncbi:MAG: hypothetical protein QM723_16175 [Myxococcaceae bacterium]
MIAAALLITVLSGAPEVPAEAPPPPATFYRFEVWSEPVSLVGTAVLGGMNQTASAIVPLGAEVAITPWLAIHAEVAGLFANHDGEFQQHGALGALGVQWRFARVGRATFFVEPRLVGAWLEQKGFPYADCNEGGSCPVNTVAREYGVGLNIGLNVLFERFLLAVVVGGQVTTFRGVETSVIGLGGSVLSTAITSPRSAWLLTPNLSLVRLGFAF